MGLIGTEEAASRLKVTVRRVRALIESGSLKAQKIGRDWLLEESEVTRISKLNRPAGRPRKSK